MSRSWISRLRMDPYILAIFGMIVLASLLPSRGHAAEIATGLTSSVIALLFFLYGARLSSETILAGLTHWRLQLVVILCTYGLFPILGLVFSALARPWLGSSMAQGIIFLSVLPSTVQSSIAFTSIARGNVPAALCAASLSNLVGVVITPLFAGILLARHGISISGQSIRDIGLQLLAPFLLGQASRRLLAGFVGRHRRPLSYIDRLSILLVVYTAFSEGVVNGIWHQVDAEKLAMLLLMDIVLLAIVLLVTTLTSRKLGFDKKDEIAIVFCGSKKSLASGLPMANILFPSQTVGLIVLPVMLFHQIQLMACATLARRYAARNEVPGRVRDHPKDERANRHSESVDQQHRSKVE